MKYPQETLEKALSDVQRVLKENLREKLGFLYNDPALKLEVDTELRWEAVEGEKDRVITIRITPKIGL